MKELESLILQLSQLIDQRYYSIAQMVRRVILKESLNPLMFKLFRKIKTTSKFLGSNRILMEEHQLLIIEFSLRINRANTLLLLSRQKTQDHSTSFKLLNRSGVSPLESQFRQSTKRESSLFYQIQSLLKFGIILREM